jgi:hypothetical protein
MTGCKRPLTANRDNLNAITLAQRVQAQLRTRRVIFHTPDALNFGRRKP